MISKYLGDKPFWKVTIRLALPIAFQNMLTSSFALIDTLMVSRLGDLALSSVGMAGQWSWFMGLIIFGLCSGMSVFAAQYWGIEDFRSMRRVFGLSTCFAIAVSTVFLIAALVSPAAIISLFNKNDAVIQCASDYIKIACFSYPAVALTTIMSGFLRNIEKVRIPMYVSLITTITNAVLNYVLIFGKLGLPQMGVKGAATATCISSWTGPVLLLIISIAQKNHMVQDPKDLLSFRWHHVLAFIKRAFPVVLNETVWALGIVILQTIYSNMGYEYYAAVTILKTFTDLSFAFFVGLGNACVIMVGKSVGSGEIRNCINDARRFSILVPLTACFIGTLLIIFRAPLVSFFNLGNNISELTLSTALFITMFCGFELPLRNIPYIQIVGIFRSGGDTVIGMVCDVGSLWVLAIPAAAVASKVFGLPFNTVFMIAYLAEDIPKAIMCITRYLSKKWIKPVTSEGIAGLEEWKNSKSKTSA